MTTGKLKELLEGVDPSLPILFDHDGILFHSTYHNFTTRAINEWDHRTDWGDAYEYKVGEEVFVIG